MHSIPSLVKLEMRGYVFKFPYISYIGDFYSLYILCQVLRIFATKFCGFQFHAVAPSMTVSMRKAALDTASHNDQWQYKFQKQICLVILFGAFYGTVECEGN